jgi:hypothetical protein
MDVTDLRGLRFLGGDFEMGGGCSGRRPFLALALAGLATIGSVVPATHAAAGSKPGSTTPAWAVDIVGLLAYVPESYRGSCDIFDTASNEKLAAFDDSILASVRCRPPDGADYVFYTAFDDADVMDEAFDAFNPPPEDGSGGCPDTGTWQQDDVDAGRWTCYFSDEVYGVDEAVVINWTHDDTAILANAFREDDDADALDEWWSSDAAGPLAEPTSGVLPNGIVYEEGWRNLSAALKRDRVPASHRASCRTVEHSRDGLGDALWRRRIWLRAAVICRPDGIHGVTYYEFDGNSDLDVESPVEAFFRTQVDAHVDEDEPRVSARDIDCEGSGTWSQEGEERGRYACWYIGDGDIADYAVMEWTSTDGEILGYATSTDGRARPLIEFWDDEAGPSL